MQFSDRLKNIKLVIADLDGTLLDNEGMISSEAYEMIKELKQKGVVFSFASGRLHSALIDFIKELDLKAPIISLDGCLIKNYPGGEIFFESFIPVKHVKKALNYADNFLLNIALCHADEIFFTERNSLIPNIMEKFGAKYTEVPSYDNFLENTLEITIASDVKENIKYVFDKMNPPYSFGLNCSFFKSQSHSGIYYLEIRKKGSDKGKALIKLTKYLKIKLRETAVIGDWYNDISLFHPKTLKITLKNGIPELKKMSDIKIDKDNNNGGIEEFLNMMIKAKQ
jgi:Cof subfamily protein (haloacid dehalogenase superfamily)